MTELGRAALVVALGLRCTRSSPAPTRRSPRRRLAALGAERAHRGVRLDARRRRGARRRLVRDDFSLAYVADHSSRELSARYTLSAFWGGQEGSLLLWLLVLTGYSALAVWLDRTGRATSSSG